MMAERGEMPVRRVDAFEFDIQLVAQLPADPDSGDLILDMKFSARPSRGRLGHRYKYRS
jgi:hypothetical protein